MKVVLLRDIVKLGKKGEIKEVSEGYGNNYLLKLGYAKIATSKVQEQIIKNMAAAEAKNLKELANLEQLKTELGKRTFTVKVKVGDKGQIFGSVQEKDIIKAINSKLKVQLEKNQIETHGIKTLGEHEIIIKLGHGFVAKTKLNIESL